MTNEEDQVLLGCSFCSNSERLKPRREYSDGVRALRDALGYARAAMADMVEERPRRFGIGSKWVTPQRLIRRNAELVLPMIDEALQDAPKPADWRCVEAVGKGWLATRILAVCPSGVGRPQMFYTLADVPDYRDCGCGERHFFYGDDMYVTFVMPDDEA